MQATSAEKVIFPAKPTDKLKACINIREKDMWEEPLDLGHLGLPSWEGSLPSELL